MYVIRWYDIMDKITFKMIKQNNTKIIDVNDRH